MAAIGGWPLRGVPLYSSSETDDRIDSEPCELAINNSSVTKTCPAQPISNLEMDLREGFLPTYSILAAMLVLTLSPPPPFFLRRGKARVWHRAQGVFKFSRPPLLQHSGVAR